jgi:hypothetical protein
MFSLLAGWVRCCWRCSSVQCSTRSRPAPGPPPDARIPTTDVTTSCTPARARILLVANPPGAIEAPQGADLVDVGQETPPEVKAFVARMMRPP